MKKHTCHLDLHQRSHYVTIGQRNWVRKFRQPEGEVARQPEGEVARQAKFFQPAQPTPNPIRDRSGRLDEMQDERKTSRSQEISVNSLTKNPVLQIEQVDVLKQRKIKHVHLKTARVSMLSRLMIEQGDLLLTQLQYKTTLKYIMKPTRSTLMKKYFVKEWRNPLLFMTRIMN